MREEIIAILQNEVFNAFDDCGNPFPVIDGDIESIGDLANKIIALVDSKNAAYDEADLDEHGNPLPDDEGCSIYDPDYRNLCMDCGRLFWTKLRYAVHCPECIEEERYKK